MGHSLRLPSAASASIAAAPPQGPGPDWLARIIALGGLGLSLAQFFFNRRKADRDRRLSIEDDFWLRKVLSPTVLEPLLKVIVDLLNALPTRDASEASRMAYALEVTEKFQRLSVSVQMLELYHSELPAIFLGHLTSCEDLLSTYSNDLAHAVSDSAEPPNINTVRTAVWKEVNRAMVDVRERQKNH